MINFDKLKLIRISISAFAFLCVFTIMGMQMREAHQFVYILGIMAICGLLLDNIWLTLFLWLTIFVYSVFKFETGYNYLTNVFFGCMMYKLVKSSFKKEHINFYIKIILWVLVANLFYGVIQAVGCDFIYSGEEGHGYLPKGFMGNSSVTSIFIVMCIPLLMTRGSLLSKIGACMLFIPLWILHSSLNFLCGGVVFLFTLWFMIPKRIWIIVLMCCILIGTIFLVKKDLPGVERFDMWRNVLVDAKSHPIIGWGLDSFRNTNKIKNYIYVQNLSGDGGYGNIQHWDNPHNLYISLFYEFGALSLILLIGYIRQLVIWFRNSPFHLNKIALYGVMLSFFITSLGHFPMFVCRIAVIIITFSALVEVQTKGELKND